MRRAAELVLYPFLALTLLIVFLYRAFLMPEALRLPAILLELFLMVACFYLFYFFQRPGIHKSKSPGRWFWHIGLATAWLALIPVMGIVMYFTGPLGIGIRLNKLLALDFRFEPGEKVQLRTDATTNLRPQAQGSVVSSRVLRRREWASPHAREGTVMYLVQWEDGSCSEAPEQFLKEAGSVLAAWVAI